MDCRWRELAEYDTLSLCRRTEDGAASRLAWCPGWNEIVLTMCHRMSAINWKDVNEDQRNVWTHKEQNVFWSKYNMYVWRVDRAAAVNCGPRESKMQLDPCLQVVDWEHEGGLNLLALSWAVMGPSPCSGLGYSAPPPMTPLRVDTRRRKHTLVSETTFSLIPFCPRSSFNSTILSLNQSTVILGGITSTINTVCVISTPGWTSSAAKRQRCPHNSPHFAVWSEMIVTGKMFQNSHLSAASTLNKKEHVTVYFCCQTGPATLVA